MRAWFPGEDEVVAEVARLTDQRGSIPGVALELGVTPQHLYGIRNGNARIGVDLAGKLGFRKVVRWERTRAEELALADQIERENGWRRS